MKKGTYFTLRKVQVISLAVPYITLKLFIKNCRIFGRLKGLIFLYCDRFVPKFIMLWHPPKHLFYVT